MAQSLVLLAFLVDIPPLFIHGLRKIFCNRFNEAFHVSSSTLCFPYPILSSLDVTVAVVLCTLLRCIQMCLVMCMFTATFLAINNASDDDNRGASNGLAMLIGSVSKGLGPIVASILFAWSINNDSTFPFDHHFIFFVISTLTFALYLILRSEKIVP